MGFKNYFSLNDSVKNYFFPDFVQNFLSFPRPLKKALWNNFVLPVFVSLAPATLLTCVTSKLVDWSISIRKKSYLVSGFILRCFSTTFVIKLTWIRRCFCYDIFQSHKLCIFIHYYLIKKWRRFPDFVVSFALKILSSCCFSPTVATLRSRQEKSSFDRCYLQRHDVHRERRRINNIFQLHTNHHVFLHSDWKL